jgi:hypothetical protein
MKYYLLYLKTKKKCRLMRRLLVKIPAIEDLWKVQVRILESNFILFFCHEKHLRITSKLKKLIFNVKIFFNWLRNLKLNQIKKYLSPSLLIEKNIYLKKKFALAFQVWKNLSLSSYLNKKILFTMNILLCVIDF